MQKQETGNGATGAPSSVAGGVRGDAPAPVGDSMWPEEGARPLAGSTPPQGAPSYHPAPAASYPSPQSGIVAPLGKWGHNTRLNPRDVKRAILEHVQRLASTTGQQVPHDIVDFLERADVVFLDENQQPINFNRVILTWES